MYNAGGSGADALDNLFVDPLFVNSAVGNYRLAEGSPMIDAADPINAPVTDLDGFSRPHDGDGDEIALADIGAFEFPSGEVSNLLFTDGATLTWDFEPELSYNIYRGRLLLLRSQGNYTQNPGLNGVDQFCGVPGAPYVDPFEPALFDVAIYLVTLTGTNFEGPLGTDSEDIERLNTNTCP